MFIEKFKESISSVLPVSIFVLLIHCLLIHAPTPILIKFILGSLFIMVGLTMFLWGAELSITPFGDLTGERIAKSNSKRKVFLSGLVLGSLITIAEPDLMILANQISNVTGSISPNLIVLTVSLGVGIFLAFGFLKILYGINLSKIFTICYGCIFFVLIFVKEEFHGIAFDASGATTGAMTTPFILALGLGVSRLKGSRRSEEDSFGLVGMASCGPILSILLLSFFFPNIEGPLSMNTTNFDTQIILSILSNLLLMMKETVLAIFPLFFLFLFLNNRIFHLNSYTLQHILKGFIYTFIGLVVFLTGVNAGFIDYAKLMGRELAVHFPQIVPLIGFLIGLVVVLAEPAVYMLSLEVEEVTGGNISRKMLMVSLCVGVAMAVLISILKIYSSWVKLWMILAVGFSFAIILSYKVPKIFVGIAFDSGGVASGPMTATFLLSYVQGVAEMSKDTNLLIDGFGVIALVALMPIISIHILGYIHQKKLSGEETAIE